MPKVVKKACDRQRQDRFSREELTMLAETLQDNAAVVFSTQMSRMAIAKKKAIWSLVAQRVSAVGSVPRNTQQCRKRWDDLRLRIRSILSANRNLGTATGGGCDSPIKLQAWEEICASTIGMESIQGGGGMERGVPTSGDAAASSDSEARSIEEIDDGSPAAHPHSRYTSLSPLQADATQGQMEAEDWQATPSPLPEVSSPMGMPMPLAMSQRNQQTLDDIVTRQQQLSTLLNEHVAECVGARDAMEKCADRVTAAIESSTKDICTELAAVRHVLSEQVQTIRESRSNVQPGPSSSASSAQSSPIRRSGRNLRSTGRGAPGARGGDCH
ncbi:myb-related transcription factor, partner of profilin-like [Ambystoma mexicanum]|uniref:myb-related transcription factor, partner of profilin-like n=1 Tax=Ambystoma mexicanum TaxID=8296 RepID=UPI0037E81F48